MPSLSHLQSSVWTDYISDINHAAHLVSSSTALAFLKKKRVRIFCHRVSTKLQLTNISISNKLTQKRVNEVLHIL